ncbi:hypothetical protein FQR65_LT08538 [Abscondita terminalis]|nr:hypothetical protein FQR65_LT08538 [Abscondita terminalis]
MERTGRSSIGNYLETKIENLAVIWFMCMNVYGSFMLPCVLILLIVVNYYFVIFVITYILWIWYVDEVTPEQGGRRWEFMQNLKLWVYFRNYFPIDLKRDEFFKLSARRNYLFCYFPAGIAGIGNFLSFGTAAGGFKQLFPNHRPYSFALDSDYKIPLYREYLLSLGYCKATPSSIKWVLSNSEGGNAGILVVGDPLRSEFVHPNGRLWFIFRHKKGFVKLAIKNGTPIIPVIGFGELDAVERNIEQKSKVQVLYDWLKYDRRVVPALKHLFLPKRNPINVIVGKPINIQQVPHPTQNEVEFVHKVFIYRLTELFEKYKYTYLSDPDNTHMLLY